jgi:hypothetical protein
MGMRISTNQPSGESSEDLVRIRKELGRLEREKLVLLKLIGPTTVLAPDAGSVSVNALAGRDEAVRSLLEVEKKIKRSLNGLARREIDLK